MLEYEFWASAVIEISFLIEIIFSFFKQYTPVGKNKPVSDFRIICGHYIHG